MPNVSLGDGICTVTGEGRGSGSDKFVNVTNPSQPYIDTDYDLDLIRNYKDLRKFLNIQTSLVASTPIVSGSTQLDITNSTHLNKDEVTLVLKFRKFYEVKKLTDRTLKAKALLENAIEGKDPQGNLISQHPIRQFYNGYGDEFITQVFYGKEFYAVIKYTDLKQEKAFEVKQNLNITLKKIQGIDLTASEKLNYKKEALEQYQNCQVTIKCPGSHLNIPSFVTSLDQLLDIIKVFNDDKSSQYYPLGYTSETYATILDSANADKLADQMVLVKNYLYKFDNRVSKLNLLLNNLEQINKRHDVAVSDRAIITIRDAIEKAKRVITDSIADIRRQATEINKAILDRYSHNINQIDFADLELKVLELNAKKEGVRLSSGKVKNLVNHKSSSGAHLNLSLTGNVNLFWQVDPNSHLHPENIRYKVLRKKKGGIYHDVGLKFKGTGTHFAVNNFSEKDKYCIASPKGHDGEDFTVVIRKASEYDALTNNHYLTMQPTAASNDESREESKIINVENIGVSMASSHASDEDSVPTPPSMRAKL